MSRGQLVRVSDSYFWTRWARCWCRPCWAEPVAGISHQGATRDGIDHDRAAAVEGPSNRVLYVRGRHGAAPITAAAGLERRRSRGVWKEDKTKPGKATLQEHQLVCGVPHAARPGEVRSYMVSRLEGRSRALPIGSRARRCAFWIGAIQTTTGVPVRLQVGTATRATAALEIRTSSQWSNGLTRRRYSRRVRRTRRRDPFSGANGGVLR